MHIQHLIFRPMLSGFYSSEIIPLDQTTPRGLFMSPSGNRYLVCDDPMYRFAVVLQHSELAPFTAFELGGLPADMGRSEGIGVIHLGKVLEWDRVNAEPGKLDLENDQVSMLVLNLDGRNTWRTIAHGWGGATGMYTEWAFMIDEDMPFFGDGW